MWDLGWLWRPHLPPPPSSLCSRGTPSHGPHPLTLLLSSCFDLCWPESPLSPSPSVPLQTSFVQPLSTAPLTPVATAAPLYTQVCVCVCVCLSVCLCSLMLLTVLLTTSSTISLNTRMTEPTRSGTLVHTGKQLSDWTSVSRYVASLQVFFNTFLLN